MNTTRNKNKRKIQQYLYLKSPTRSSIIGLLGPSIAEYYPILLPILTPKAVAILYDNDKDITLLYPNKFPKVEQRKEDIVNSYSDITRFVDLDLCKTIKTQAELIEFLFKCQLKRFKHSNKTKTFMFTTSLRGSSECILNKFNKHLISLLPNKSYKFESISYRDTVIMNNTQIIYK